MIYYLAHPYSKFSDKEQPWEYAVAWVAQLRKMGLYVFSPILHTHCYSNHAKGIEDEKWLPWDLALIAVAGFMKGDGGIIWKCNAPDCKSHVGKFHHCTLRGHSTHKHIKYDSGITVLLSKNAFKTPFFKQITKELLVELYEPDPTEQFIEILDELWTSQGCRQEYEFAKKHHIRVLELESLLQGTEREL